MTPEERWSLLASAGQVALEDLANRILAEAAVEIVTGPEVRSIPLRLTNNTGDRVVLGHLACTRATVLLQGVRGDGLRTGRDLVGALAAAVCDAEVERGGHRTPEVLQLCGKTAAVLDRSRSEEAALVEATRLGDPDDA